MSTYYNRSPAATARKKTRTGQLVKETSLKKGSLINELPAHLSVIHAQPRSEETLVSILDKQQRTTEALVSILDKQQRTTEALANMPEEQMQNTDALHALLSEQQRDIKALVSVLDRQQSTTEVLVNRPVLHGVPEVFSIAIDNVSKQFGHFQAVKQLSLNVRQGEIFGLLGPNGSGKTTTINMISGLSTPTSGKIRVLGYDVRTQGRKVRQLLGCVPQETALFEELSAWHNMEYHAHLFNVPRKEMRARIVEMLQLVSLLERKDARVKTCSGGMKRRLALARALLHDPQLLYLDEPTLGVDVQSRRALWDYIIGLREQGKTVLITTNYLEEAQHLCDRIAILDHGQLVEVDTPDRMKQRHGGRIIELELSVPVKSLENLRLLAGVQHVQQVGAHLTFKVEGEQDCLPQIINLVTRQAEVQQIEVREPTLDDVFLNITGKLLRD